jgi:hypothetical protein
LLISLDWPEPMSVALENARHDDRPDPLVAAGSGRAAETAIITCRYVLERVFCHITVLASK